MTLVNELEKDAYIFGIRGPIEQAPGFAYFTIESVTYLPVFYVDLF